MSESGSTARIPGRFGRALLGLALAWLGGMAILAVLSGIFAFALTGEGTQGEHIAWFTEAMGTSAAGPLGFVTTRLSADAPTWWPWGVVVLICAALPWIALLLVARAGPSTENAVILFFISFLWHAWGFTMFWMQGL